MDDNKIMAERRRAVADFRKSLPKAGTPLHVCPPNCAVKHDAGKHAGRDHWRKTEA